MSAEIVVVLAVVVTLMCARVVLSVCAMVRERAADRAFRRRVERLGAANRPDIAEAFALLWDDELVRGHRGR